MERLANVLADIITGGVVGFALGKIIGIFILMIAAFVGAVSHTKGVFRLIAVAGIAFGSFALQFKIIGTETIKTMFGTTINISSACNVVLVVSAIGVFIALLGSFFVSDN